MEKLLIGLAIVGMAILAGCKKDKITPEFSIEVLQGEVTLLYQVDGVSISQTIEEGYKPVLPSELNEIEVICNKDCVYTVNGKTYRDSMFFEC